MISISRACYLVQHDRKVRALIDWIRDYCTHGADGLSGEWWSADVREVCFHLYVAGRVDLPTLALFRRIIRLFNKIMTDLELMDKEPISTWLSKLISHPGGQRVTR